jgi:hypothetical protein
LQQRDSAIKLQALYRGHIGRLAAMKWAVKKAEIDAMRALQHAAAVAIERIWRGVTGRGEAEERRKYSSEGASIANGALKLTFLFILPLLYLFHCLCHGLLSLKHPNKSFLTQSIYFDIFYTLYYCFIIYFFRLTSK